MKNDSIYLSAVLFGESHSDWSLSSSPPSENSNFLNWDFCLLTDSLALSAESILDELPIRLSHCVEWLSDSLVNSLYLNFENDVVLLRACLRMDCRYKVLELTTEL